MFVNEITEKIDAFDVLPYDCVFFNGLWGIGKSYAADQIKDKEKIVRVSLSGLKTADEIYAEILDAYVGSNGFTKVVGKVAGTAIKVAANFDQTKIASGVVSDVTGSFLSAKVSLRIYFNRQQKIRIIVLDDFERVWDGIDITEVFRVVEFLINQKNVKVAMIGDLTKLSDSIESKFRKYSERYIDRIYDVTDISSDIDWGNEPLCIDKKFITEFKALHNFHNLRSVIKANNFYKDVKITLLKNSKSIKENSDRFWNDLRLTAFALVIESIDELKLSEVQSKSVAQKESAVIQELSKRLESRVYKYLNGSKFGAALCNPLNEYYQTNFLDVGLFEAIHNESLKDDTPAYFYSDAETIKMDLPRIRNEISSVNNLNDLVKTIRDYTQLCGLCGEKYEDMILIFRNRLHEMVVSLINQDITDVFDSGYFAFTLENQQLLDILNEEFSKAKSLMIDYWINQLLKNEYTEREYNLAKRVSDYYYSDEYKRLIEDRFSDLLCAKIFPIDAHNDIQYYTSVEILKILNRIDGKELEHFYLELKKRIKDPVALHRCNSAMKHLGDS